MSPIGTILSVLRTAAVVCLLAVATPTFGAAPAVTAAPPTKLEAVFQSIRDRGDRSEATPIAWKPILLGIAGIGLMTLSIKQWNRRKAKPKIQSLHNHRKLLKTAARKAGVSSSQLTAIAPLTQSQGLSSPLVALLCPSTIKSLAQNARTADQQAALKGLTKTLLKREAIKS